MFPKTIAIVGLGLMGGSLAARCRRQFPKARIIGISRNRRAIRLALKKKWIHQGTHQLKQGIQKADLIVLCTPVDTLLPLLQKIDSLAAQKVLVTDVGSTKHQILSVIQRKKWKKVSFVGAHPMVGSHARGMEAAQPHLYDAGFTFVIRDKKEESKSFKAIRLFWKKITPKVFEVSSKDHDKIVSEISHLPHVLAVCLMLAVPKKALSFAACGFRDMTRLAEGHPSIWLPILQSNRQSIAQALSQFIRQLESFKRSLSSARDQNLHQILTHAMQKRRKLGNQT